MKYITPKCYEVLTREINDIQNNQLPLVAEEISIARSHGDLRENAQYASAKEKQRMIESRLHELTDVISTYTVVEIEGKKFNSVSFGSTVEIKFLDDNSTKKFQILSDYDSDISNGTISINAPIVKFILDLPEGVTTEMFIGGRTRSVIIQKIY